MSPAPRLHAVYLEAKDEITSVIDQIRGCPDSRIALVGADRSSLLQSLVNLKLLKRNCELLGKELILITTDPVASALSGQIGLVTYPKLASAEYALFGKAIPPVPQKIEQSAPLPQLDVPERTEAPVAMGPDPIPPVRPPISVDKPARPRPPTEKQQNVNLNNRGALLVILFAALIPVIALVYAAWAVFPSARILLVPKTQEFAQDVTVRAAPRYTEVNFFSREMPLTYAEATEQGSLTAKTTQRADLGTKATGTITIFNLCATDPITFPAGYEITSYDGKVFVIVNPTVVEGLSVQAGVQRRGEKYKVAVEAKGVGEEYNIEPADFVIPYGDCTQKLLWGESNNAFDGGASRDAVVLGQNDIDTLRTKLLTDLTNRSRASMTAQVPEGRLVLTDTTESRITAETISAQVGDEVPDFTITLTIQTRGLALQESDLIDLVTRVLSTSIPADFEPLTSQKWDISYEVQSFDLDAKTLDLTAKGKGLVAMRIASPDLKTKLLGKTKNTAEQVLELYKDKLDSYQVQLSPFYVRSVPSSSDKVTINKLTWDEFQAKISK